MINARAETVTEKPSFRNAFKQRRCLILADGFYEWQRTKTQKQPYYFQRSDGQPFAFAGLWERWQGESGPIESCTILTTQANELLQPIHDRMPVMLATEDSALWLHPTASAEQLLALLHPYAAESMQSHPVSPLVNRAGVDSPECVNSL
jgi:putative SOS response-associated peptidase YedK